MIRISSGRLKGRRIPTLKGLDIRPTLSKTRDAIFDTLSSRYALSEFAAYDLFAGSGAMGFEAYSRGVERVVFVDSSGRAVSLLRKSIAQLSIPHVFQTFNEDAVQWMRSRNWRGSRGLFLIDPPYRSDLAARVVDAAERQSQNLEGSLLVIETERDHDIALPSRWKLFRQRRLGKTRLDFIEIARAISRT